MVLAIATHGRAEHEKNPPRGCELGEFKPECVCVCACARTFPIKRTERMYEKRRGESERESEKSCKSSCAEGVCRGQRKEQGVARKRNGERDG